MLSQVLSGQKINWRQAAGAAANGAITGADNTGYYSPYTYGRDFRNSCGGTRQPGKSLGYSTSRGYQYGVSTTTPVQNNKKYSIKGFCKESLFGGLMGGLSGAAFYES